MTLKITQDEKDTLEMALRDSLESRREGLAGQVGDCRKVEREIIKEVKALQAKIKKIK